MTKYSDYVMINFTIKIYSITRCHGELFRDLNVFNNIGDNN